MTGPRIGSMAWRLTMLCLDGSTLFEVPDGTSVTIYMQLIAACMSRNKLSGKMSQSHLLCIEPATRRVFDVVRVTRIAE